MSGPENKRKPSRISIYPKAPASRWLISQRLFPLGKRFCLKNCVKFYPNFGWFLAFWWRGISLFELIKEGLAFVTEAIFLGFSFCHGRRTGHLWRTKKKGSPSFLVDNRARSRQPLFEVSGRSGPRLNRGQRCLRVQIDATRPKERNTKVIGWNGKAINRFVRDKARLHALQINQYQPLCLESRKKRDYSSRFRFIWCPGPDLNRYGLFIRGILRGLWVRLKTFHYVA